MSWFRTCGVQMGLQNGLTYPLVMFLAQRHAPPATPAFDFSTSVEFASGQTAAAYCEASTPDPGNSAANDTSLGRLLTCPRLQNTMDNAILRARRSGDPPEVLGEAATSSRPGIVGAWELNAHIRWLARCRRCTVPDDAGAAGQWLSWRPRLQRGVGRGRQ